MDLPIMSGPETQTIYRSDSYQFVALAIFCLYSFFVGLFINPYAPIAEPLHIAYNISVPQIISTMLCFLAGKTLSAPVSGIMLEKIGLKPGLYISLMLMVVGCFLRTQLETAFWLVLLGQFVLGTAAAVVVSSQLKFLYEWFHPSTRGYFTTFVSFALIFGGGLGLVFILLFIKDSEKNPEVIRAQLGDYDKTMLIMVLVLTILHTFFFLSKPREGFGYVSVGAETKVAESELVPRTEKIERSTLPVTEELRQLLAQPLFRHYLAMYVCVCGINLTITSMVTIMYDEFGIQGWRKVSLVVTSMTVGLVGSMYFMRVCLPTPDHKQLFTKRILLAFTFSCISLTMLFLGAPFGLLLLCQACYSFCFFFAMPVTMEYVIRNTKDTPLTFVNGFMFFFGQSFACVMLFITQMIFEALSGHIRVGIITSNILTSSLMLFLAYLSNS